MKDKNASSQVAPGTEDWEATPKPDEEAWVRDQLDKARAATQEKQADKRKATDEENTGDEAPTRGVPVGGVKPAPRKWSYYLLRVIGVLAMVALVVWMAGFFDRRGYLPLLRRVGPWSEPTFELVQARNGRVLLTESDKRHSRVILQVPDQPSWLLISRDDLHAVNPTLSPGGEAVAYVSTADKTTIVVVSLNDNSLLTIMDRHVRASSVSQALPEMSICEWTPLAWSPDDKALAFYGCRIGQPYSMAYVARWDNEKVEVKPLLDSGASLATARQVEWLGSDSVVLSVPGETGFQVKTLPVPK